jgi:hypothetical protein
VVPQASGVLRDLYAMNKKAAASHPRGNKRKLGALSSNMDADVEQNQVAEVRCSMPRNGAFGIHLATDARAASGGGAAGDYKRALQAVA